MEIQRQQFALGSSGSKTQCKIETFGEVSDELEGQQLLGPSEQSYWQQLRQLRVFLEYS
jgi:hypothetical protein